MHPLTDRETAAILAALRCYQQERLQQSSETIAFLNDIATNGGQLEELHELDALCEKLNQPEADPLSEILELCDQEERFDYQVGNLEACLRISWQHLPDLQKQAAYTEMQEFLHDRLGLEDEEVSTWTLRLEVSTLNDTYSIDRSFETESVNLARTEGKDMVRDLKAFGLEVELVEIFDATGNSAWTKPASVHHV